MLFTLSRCFLYHSFVLVFLILARLKGPFSRSSCGRLLWYFFSNWTGHLRSPVANMFGRTVRCFVLSPPCLVFVGFFLNVTYSMPLSSTQKRLPWSCVLAFHSCQNAALRSTTSSEKTRGLLLPRLCSFHSFSSSSTVSAFAALGLLPLPCCRRHLTLPLSTNFD